MSWNNSNLKTARGITVGSTEEDVFSAYPKESILLKDESHPNVDRVIVIGFPGDDPVYAVKDHSKIAITILDGKVVEVVITFGHQN